MQTLTDEPQHQVADIASRHGVSADAATQVLAAIAAGGGRQAQFNHAELGGMGQWSQGGMTMIGDMFNQRLKAKVAALCGDLADLVGDRSCPIAAEASSRWPRELGAPSSSGSQNEFHYAVFPASRRLAIERDGKITVYDTGDHRISGVSQQQADDQSLHFTSQSGTIRLTDLKIVGDRDEGDDAPLSAPPSAPADANAPTDAIFSQIERLADLRNRDIITAEEFAAKKAELLARL